MKYLLLIFLALSTTLFASNFNLNEFFGSSSSGGKTKKIHTYKSSDAWTRPVGVDVIWVTLYGAGGGGAGGCGGASPSSGGGGAGGAVGALRYPIDITGIAVGASIPVTIGAGGAGGSSCNHGIPGGVTSFGTFITIAGAWGGGPGVGGSGVTCGGAGPYHNGCVSPTGSKGGVGGTIGGGGGGGGGNPGIGGNGGAGGANGGNGTGIGSGGAGGGNGGGYTGSGGSGAPGAVIVEWEE